MGACFRLFHLHAEVSSVRMMNPGQPPIQQLLTLAGAECWSASLPAEGAPRPHQW